MSETEPKGIFSCAGMCWIIGALLGLAAFLILKVRMEMSAMIALIVGIGVLLLAAMVVRKIFCGEIASAALSVAAKSAAPAAGEPKAAASNSASVTKTSTAEADAAKAAAFKEAADAKAAADAAAAKKVADAKAAAAAADAKAAEAKAAAKAVAPAKAAKKPAAKKPAAKKAPARKPVAADGRPEALDGPRDSGADDLKQIKGVGPKMEQLLNSLGFYHFDQVAGWRAKEVKWVDENLQGFKGRVSRDEWVKQAKVLAKGGVTEFSKKVKKGGIY